MSAMASQIISLATVCSTVYSDADQRKHQSSASLSFVWGIHRWPVNSPASQSFAQLLVQPQIKENIKAPRHWTFVRGIHRWPMNSPHKGPVTRKMFPFDDVIMIRCCFTDNNITKNVCQSQRPVLQGRASIWRPSFVVNGFPLQGWDRLQTVLSL